MSVLSSFKLTDCNLSSWNTPELGGFRLVVSSVKLMAYPMHLSNGLWESDQGSTLAFLVYRFRKK